MQNDLFLIKGEITQNFVAQCGEGAPVKAGSDGGQLKLRRRPSQGRREPANHAIGSLVMAFLVFGSANIVHESCHVQNHAKILVGVGRRNFQEGKPVEQLPRQGGDAAGVGDVRV